MDRGESQGLYCVQEGTVIAERGESQAERGWEGVVIVDRGESQGGKGWERVVIVDKGESQGLRLRSGGVVIPERGESHGGRGWEEVVVVDRGESQGLVLCPGGRGDRGQPGDRRKSQGVTSAGVLHVMCLWLHLRHQHQQCRRHPKRQGESTSAHQWSS